MGISISKDTQKAKRKLPAIDVPNKKVKSSLKKKKSLPQNWNVSDDV